MSAPARVAGPDLQTLRALFPPVDDLASFAYVAPQDVPELYHGLLVHTHHMTVTVEAHHGDLVDVRILNRVHVGDSYARRILLTLQKTGRVVQFGIVRINLRSCSPEVRATILEGKTPLGRILIQHNVLRRIQPTAYLRVVPGSDLMSWFGLSRPQATYGRLAIIYCDVQPAIELLEIVAPEQA